MLAGWAARNWLNRDRAAAALATVPLLRPVVSCHRAHRLARDFSQGWVICPKRIVAAGRPVPSFRSRQVSRGYSMSQPCPNASVSIRS